MESDSDGMPIPDTAWWESFGDPVLNACIEEALQNNHDIQVARYRIRAARAMRRMESSRFWPDIDARAAYLVDRMSANNPRFGDAIDGGFFPRDVEYWDLGFDVTWELDVFGGTRRRTEAATARLEEQTYQRRALLLSITAEVARNYLELRGNQLRLALLEEQIRNAAERTRFLERKRDGGLIPADALLAGRAQSESLLARQPSLQADIRAGVYRIAVLMGRRPEDFPDELDLPAPLPVAEGRVPVGLPSDLLERRPDVRAAERRLAAATADIGVARSEFFPRFFLTGSPTLQSGDFSSLFNGASSAWVFGPSVNWKLFSGGRNQAQLEAVIAQKEQVFIEYEATISQVLKEVEESLVRYAGEMQTLQRLTETASLQGRSVELQEQRAKAGTTSQLAVVDARHSWMAARQDELNQQIRSLTTVVNLYKALGGGWEQAELLASRPDTTVTNETN